MLPTKSVRPKFTVSIVAFNGLTHTRRCLESVLRHLGDAELIFTDNGSTDGTLPFVRQLSELFSGIRVFANSNNLGFQEPNCRALDVAQGEYFVLLNNDCTVGPHWLEHLQAPFKHFSKCGLTGPHSGRRTLRADFVGVPTQERTFDYIQGSCLMGRTETLRTIGLFDRNLRFAYGEDSDLSLRVQEVGLELRTVPILVSHVGGATTRTVPGLDQIILANHAYLKQKWASFLNTRSHKCTSRR